MKNVFINKTKLELFSDVNEITKECWDDIAKVLSKHPEHLNVGLLQCLIKHSPSFAKNKWKWLWLSFWWNIRMVKGTNTSVLTWIYTELMPVSVEVQMDLEMFYYKYLEVVNPSWHLCDSDKITFCQFRKVDRLLYEGKNEEAAKTLCNVPNEVNIDWRILTLALSVYGRLIEKIAPAFPHFFSKSDAKATGAYKTDWALMIHGMTADPLKYDQFDGLNWLTAIYGINKKIEESKKVKNQ